ncbi:hypothetical protein [Streptomyces sp. NPDC101150]|uniref:hypothetical protein n=1 Tax=Streptomyces sp. NPDC101150 TaxID=3366114 RepID=UPI0037F7CF87
MSQLLPENDRAGGALLTMEGTGTRTVLMDIRSLDTFLELCTEEYLSCTPQDPPGCFAVLVGSLFGDIAHINRIEFARNVRASDDTAEAEFAANIVPCFGAAYNNKRRGYWCDARDLLRIDREAQRDGLDIVGSVHLHPDWHRIGPEHERGMRISEQATPMDRHMFANTRWPINMICYLESRETALLPTLAAWAPPPAAPGEGASDACAPLALRVRDGAGELLEGDSLRLPPIERVR